MNNNKQKKGLIIMYVLLILFVFLVAFCTYKIITSNDSSSNNNYADKNVYKATFILNGADTIEINELYCKYNNDKCSVIMPNAERFNGKVLGYNTSSVENAIYQIGESVILYENTKFYVISNEELVVTIDDSSIDNIEKRNVSCLTYNTNASCLVVLPFFNKSGYENRGYSNNKNSLTGFAFPNESYRIYKNITLYPISNTFARKTNIVVGSIKKIDNLYIEIENTCSNDISDKLINYIKKIKSMANYLISNGKITFLGNDTFDKIWGSNYAGMNYGPTAQRLFDVRCSNDGNNYYATIVHELAHTWDFNYSTKVGKTISSETDIVNLYNKYINNANRPFRDYSYTSVTEFFADMVRYYYLKYIDSNSQFNNESYPSDIKTIMEKYICLAKNNYEVRKCQ